MKIGLIDLDSHNFPNIPLMKLSAYHKQKNDVVEWYTPLSGLESEYDIVYISKVFSFSKDYEYPIYAKEIKKGGSGFHIKTENGKEKYDSAADKPLAFEIEHIFPDYSLYPALTKNTAFGFLTRGCPRNCAFCHVSQKEGNRSIKVAHLCEFWNGQKNIVLCDPNILACRQHEELLTQLIESQSYVNFNQGLDVRLMTDDNLSLLQKIKLTKIHLAFDRYQDKKIILPKLEKFAFKTGFDRHKGEVTVFILVNFDTTIEQDIERIQFCRSLNFSPYPMIYNKVSADPIYKKLQRWCNNFIFWKCETFEEYLNYKR